MDVLIRNRMNMNHLKRITYIIMTTLNNDQIIFNQRMERRIYTLLVCWRGKYAVCLETLKKSKI